MGSQSAGQVWRGTVTRVLDDGLVWVVIPQLMGSEPVGPMPSHGVTGVGASVLVVLLGGSRQTMIAVPDPDAQFAEVNSSLAMLFEALNGKSDTGHKHAIGDVTNLQTTLNGKAATDHTHSVATTTAVGFMSAADKALLSRIGTTVKTWAPSGHPGAAAMSHEWDPDHGWVSWIDLSKLGSTGDLEFIYPFAAGVAATSRPSGWQMTVLLSGVSGLTGLQPRVDYMNGVTRDGSNAQLSLSVWPEWAYRVEHDFILPANRAARPTFVALGVTASAVGRIGLTAPAIAAKSERSQ